MQKLVRGPRISLYGLLVMLLFLFAACGDSGTAPDAQQLLQQAQAVMKQVKSYHFTLATDHPGTGTGISLLTANGDTLAPDKIKAKSTVSFSGITADVTIITIGQQQYYTDPITGNWTPTTGIIDPHTLADPQQGIAALISHLQHPGTPADTTVDGNSCWSVEGQLPDQYIAGITGTTSPAANATVDTIVWIGKSDHRVYQIQIKGIAVAGDTGQTVRTIKFSNFNETITIEAPIK